VDAVTDYERGWNEAMEAAAQHAEACISNGYVVFSAAEVGDSIRALKRPETPPEEGPTLEERVRNSDPWQPIGTLGLHPDPFAAAPEEGSWEPCGVCEDCLTGDEKRCAAAGDIAKTLALLPHPPKPVRAAPEEKAPEPRCTAKSFKGADWRVPDHDGPCPAHPEPLDADFVNESWKKLQVKVAPHGLDLPDVRFIRCDLCDELRPDADLDRHSASGINTCLPGKGCKSAATPKEEMEPVCECGQTPRMVELGKHFLLCPRRAPSPKEEP
jgi:hypothetical protein